MKLVFPNGEHVQAVLKPGVNRIGAAADSAVVLRTPSMPAVATEIHVAGFNTCLVPNPAAEITVNGHPVRELITLRVGDRLRIAGIQATIAAVSTAHGSDANDDAATRMMTAVPKFLLRGLTGIHFGKLYPLSGTVTIGRAPECEIVLPMSEISRRHVQLRPTFGGVLVEDLGSSNGIWINDKRVQQGLLQPGDELRLDTNRFLLSAPGSEAAAPSRLSPAPPKRTVISWWDEHAAIGVVIVIVIVTIVLMLR